MSARWPGSLRSTKHAPPPSPCAARALPPYALAQLPPSPSYEDYRPASSPPEPASQARAPAEVEPVSQLCDQLSRLKHKSPISAYLCSQRAARRRTLASAADPPAATPTRPRPRAPPTTRAAPSSAVHPLVAVHPPAGREPEDAAAGWVAAARAAEARAAVARAACREAAAPGKARRRPAAAAEGRGSPQRRPHTPAASPVQPCGQRPSGQRVEASPPRPSAHERLHAEASQLRARQAAAAAEAAARREREEAAECTFAPLRRARAGRGAQPGEAPSPRAAARVDARMAADARAAAERMRLERLLERQVAEASAALPLSRPPTAAEASAACRGIQRARRSEAAAVSVLRSANGNGHGLTRAFTGARGSLPVRGGRCL